jgi:hypothetical protein
MPDDPALENMNPVLKLWMFENWLEDQNDDIELVKNHAYLIGSFINPEAVRQLTGQDGNTHSLSDEEFDKSLELVKQDRDKNSGRRRRRRKVKEVQEKV